MKASTIIRKVDISRYMANHIVGNNHTQIHRRISGFIVMVFGVVLTQLGGATSYLIIHISADIIGWGFHAVGLIPFIKNMESDFDKTTDHGNSHGADTAVYSNDRLTAIDSTRSN